MVIKGYSTFNGNKGVLQHYWSLTIWLLSVISRTLVGGVLPLCSDAVSVFNSPSQLGQQRCWVNKYILWYPLCSSLIAFNFSKVLPDCSSDSIFLFLFFPVFTTSFLFLYSFIHLHSFSIFFYSLTFFFYILLFPYILFLYSFIPLHSFSIFFYSLTFFFYILLFPYILFLYSFILLLSFSIFSLFFVCFLSQFFFHTFKNFILLFSFR